MKGISHSQLSTFIYLPTYFLIRKINMPNTFNLSINNLELSNFLLTDLLTAPIRCILEIRRNLF